jgi:hypothetical protein
MFYAFYCIFLHQVAIVSRAFVIMLQAILVRCSYTLDRLKQVRGSVQLVDERSIGRLVGELQRAQSVLVLEAEYAKVERCQGVSPIALPTAGAWLAGGLGLARQLSYEHVRVGTDLGAGQ